MGRRSKGTPLVHRCARKQKNGSVYVYERIRTFSPGKRGYDEKRRLLGILPPDSDDLYGPLLPTRPRRADKKEVTPENLSCAQGSLISKKRTGMIDIIEHLTKTSRLDEILSSILPGEEGLVQKILTCTWYNFASDGDSWPGIRNWTMQYQGILPYSAGVITKDMYHDLFVELGNREDIRFRLFKKLGELLTHESMLALDSSTFETESERLGNGRKAPHKDGVIRKVYKVVYFYAIEYRRPIAYSLIPGNIPDSETVSNALMNIEKIGLQDIEIVSDNGYCTAASIAVYIKRNQPFLMRIEANSKWIIPLVEKHRNELEHGGGVLSCDPKFSGAMEQIRHTFQRQTSHSGDKTVESVTDTVNVFIYFSSVNKAKDDVYLREKYNQCKEDLLLNRYLGRDRKKVENFSKRYMIIHRNENGRVTEITPNKAALEKALKYSGYLVLVSNKEDNMESALERFRKREYIEEDIKNYKSHTGGRKSRVWSDDTLDGEILIHFLSLILHETFELRVQKMSKSLAQLNGDPNHDNSNVLDIERQLLSFLRKNSLHDQLHWFDALVTREHMESNSGITWCIKTETTKRDKLYLEMLGLPPETYQSNDYS